MMFESPARLVGRKFRAGSAFELVVFDRLLPEERAVLGELRNDQEFYGILRPRPDSGRTIKSVSKDTALLWLTLQSPGQLPFFVFDNNAEAAYKTVWEFVLDGVLEVEENGMFITGAEAAGVFSENRRTLQEGRLARLSMLALRYGASLDYSEPEALAEWLYQFGRVPVSPYWANRLPNGEAVLSFVTTSAEGDVSRRLNAGWEMVEGWEGRGWLTWTSLKRNELGHGKVTHKLYISPQIEAIPKVFATVLDVLSMSMRSIHFKIGSNAAGLLRPDKMVLYFHDQESLLAVASELGKRLLDVPPHGVPFSAEITPNGLLSWGMDPPQSEQVLAWQEPASWRQWVVRRLAAAMIAAKKDSRSTMTPAEFALERLHHEGVDVDGWTPSAVIWHAA